MTKLNNLRDLYIDQLEEIYTIEWLLVKSLPEMAEIATASKLKESIQKHFRESEGHVQRLEMIFNNLDLKPKEKPCKAMHALLEERHDLMKGQTTAEVTDAALIVLAQRIEHYEIAVYGTLRTFAQTLSQIESSRLLQQTLSEEEAADRLLTDVALTVVNQTAAAAG
jgi:ferritin-like metal-binding protein YciE